MYQLECLSDISHSSAVPASFTFAVFCCAFWPLRCRTDLLLEWVPILCPELVKRSLERPLVSGFYRLVTLIFRETARAGYFDDPLLSPTNTFDEVIIRQRNSACCYRCFLSRLFFFFFPCCWCLCCRCCHRLLLLLIVNARCYRRCESTFTPLFTFFRLLEKQRGCCCLFCAPFVGAYVATNRLLIVLGTLKVLRFEAHDSSEPVVHPRLPSVFLQILDIWTIVDGCRFS